MCCSVTKSRPSGTFDHGSPGKEGDQDRQGLREQDEHDRANQEDQAMREEEIRMEQEKRAQEAREREEREEEARRHEAARAKERQDAEEAEQERQRQAEEEQRKNKEKDDRITKVQDWMKTNGFSGDISELSTHKTSGGCCSASSTTPLHVAAQKKDHEMVELMIKSGAKVDELDSKKKTPEAVAKRCNKKGSHDLVLEKLRDPQLKAQGASA